MRSSRSLVLCLVTLTALVLWMPASSAYEEDEEYWDTHMGLFLEPGEYVDETLFGLDRGEEVKAWVRLLTPGEVGVYVTKSTTTPDDMVAEAMASWTVSQEDQKVDIEFEIPDDDTYTLYVNNNGNSTVRIDYATYDTSMQILDEAVERFSTMCIAGFAVGGILVLVGIIVVVIILGRMNDHPRPGRGPGDIGRPPKNI